jgi:hypothetical protein
VYKGAAPGSTFGGVGGRACGTIPDAPSCTAVSFDNLEQTLLRRALPGVRSLWLLSGRARLTKHISDASHCSWPVRAGCRRRGSGERAHHHTIPMGMGAASGAAPCPDWQLAGHPSKPRPPQAQSYCATLSQVIAANAPSCRLPSPAECRMRVGDRTAIEAGSLI